jgi:hypothetical protein
MLSDCDDGDNSYLDDSQWYDSDDDKDREWQRSRDEFHTVF